MEFNIASFATLIEIGPRWEAGPGTLFLNISRPRSEQGPEKGLGPAFRVKHIRHQICQSSMQEIPFSGYDTASALSDPTRYAGKHNGQQTWQFLFSFPPFLFAETVRQKLPVGAIGNYNNARVSAPCHMLGSAPQLIYNPWEIKKIGGADYCRSANVGIKLP